MVHIEDGDPGNVPPGLPPGFVCGEYDPKTSSVIHRFEDGWQAVGASAHQRRVSAAAHQRTAA